MTAAWEQPATPDVIQTHSAVYAIAFAGWVICAFAMSAMLALENVPLLQVVLMLGPLIGILFNATGFLRPKRIELRREGLAFRPVWGHSRSIARNDIAEFSVAYFHRNSGLLSCKTGATRMLARLGPRYSFGYFLEAYALADRLETWRRS